MILNRAKDYYENYKETLRNNDSMQEINIETYFKKKKMKRGNTEKKKKHNMSEEKKQRLNEYQKNYREANKYLNVTMNKIVF